MANKINRTDIYPNTTPANGDYVLGVDVSNTTNDENGEVATFRINDILATSHNHALSDVVDYGLKNPQDVATLLADTSLTYTAGQPGTVVAGDIVRTQAEGFSYEVLAPGASGDIENSASTPVQLRVLPSHDGFYPVEALGLDNTGASDVGAALSAFIAKVGKVDLEAGAIYLFSTPQTIANKANLHIRFNGAKITGPDLDGVLLVNNCAGATLDDPLAEGTQTRAIWEALTSAQRQAHRPLITVQNSPNARVTNFRGSKKSSGITLDGCPDSVVQDAFLEGICGTTLTAGVADVANKATDPNFCYSVFLRNSPRTEVRNASCLQAGGAFLCGASTNSEAEGIRVFGGTAREHHDTGYYGSTAFDILISGANCYHGLGTGQKTRGSKNRIVSGYVFDCRQLAYSVSGLPVASAVDAEGACGFGNVIIDCQDVSCDLSSRIDRVTLDTGGLGYARDSYIVNQISVGASRVANENILCFGVKNVGARNCNVKSFAQTYAIALSGVSASSMEGGEISGGLIDEGDRAWQVVNCLRPTIENVKTNNLTEIVISSIVTTTGINLVSNTDLSGDANLNRIDIRGITGVPSVTNNNGLFILANTTDRFFGVGNEMQSPTNVGSVIPARVGQIVSNGTNIYCAKATAATTDWVAL